MAWFMAHWMDVVVVLLAVDRFLITVFPSNTLFASIASWLQGIAPKE